MIGDTLHHGTWRQVNGVEHELVRMLGLDIVPLQNVIREVAQVERDDSLRVSADGGSKDVPIIRVRQIEGIFQVLKASHDAIGHCLAHQLARSGKRCWRKVRALRGNATEAFIEDTV